MHKHPRRDRGFASVMAILSPVCLLLIVAIVPIHVGSRASVAAVGPLAVYGWVNYTAAGGPVDGANVVVTIYNGLIPGATQTVATDSSGVYFLTFAPSDYNVGNTVNVNASKGVYYSNVSVVILDEFPLDINLNFSTQIPELGGTAMILLTVSAVGMMVVVYARKRRSEAP